jgi:NADPH-dependent curcumin reductase CurA
VRQLGFAACIEAGSPNFSPELVRVCPDGVDVYFDTVGGEVLTRALEHLAPHARVVLGGMIEAYSAGSSFSALLRSRATVQGILVEDHLHRLPELGQVVGSWIRAGLFHYREDVTEGLAHAPESYCRLMRGESFGKVLVRVAPEHL